MKKNYKYALNIFIIIAITALSALFLWKKGVFDAETFKNLSPAKFSYRTLVDKRLELRKRIFGACLRQARF